MWLECALSHKLGKDMETFDLRASDGGLVHCYDWEVAAPRACIHIAHGMGEHAGRYDRLAKALNAANFAVTADDHRGHGVTGAANLGYFGPDGWNRVLADAYEINQHLRSRYPETPIILLGHSMGAMLSQLYITRYGASVHAVALSGSPGFSKPSWNPIPRWILRFEQKRLGLDAQSSVMQGLLFGNANKPFDAPDASGFGWLSRDPEEVKQYVDDPLCGFVVSTGSLGDLYAGAAVAQDALAIEVAKRPC